MLTHPIESSGLSLRDANLLRHLLSSSGLVLESLDSVTKLLLVSLESLETLSVGLVSLVKTNLQLIDVSLNFLFDSQCFLFGFLFGLQTCLN